MLLRDLFDFLFDQNPMSEHKIMNYRFSIIDVNFSEDGRVTITLLGKK